MKKYLIVAVAVFALISCGQKKFHVEGAIANAKDSVLYFENIGLAGPETLDSDWATMVSSALTVSRRRLLSSIVCVFMTR